MKTVFKSDELPHIWANKSAPSGRSSSALSFDGNVIRSYSTEMARHIEHKGKAAIVINTRSYSVTTSKHQTWIRQAIPSGVPVFWYNDEPVNDGKALFEHAQAKAARALQKATKARTNKETHEGEASKWLERAKFVSDFFGLHRKVDMAKIEELRTKGEAATKREKAQREAREAKEQKRQRAAFEAWKRGKTIEGEYFSPHIFPTAFRIEGDELVSTKGARIPIREARVTHRFILSRRESGWYQNGETHSVGHYQLNAINPQGVVAGCHRITWEEIERLTPILAHSVSQQRARRTRPAGGVRILLPSHQ